MKEDRCVYLVSGQQIPGQWQLVVVEGGITLTITHHIEGVKTSFLKCNNSAVRAGETLALVYMEKLT